MSTDTNRFFVITGGPGSGKSTLIAVLKKAGYHTSDEVGRQIIKDQVSIWGPAVPRTDPALFAEMMLPWEMQNYRWLATQPGTVFFDRGIPDVIGYLSLSGLPIPAHMTKAAEIFRYNSRVFIAPPWPEIFRQADGGGGGTHLPRAGRNLRRMRL